MSKRSASEARTNVSKASEPVQGRKKLQRKLNPQNQQNHNMIVKQISTALVKTAKDASIAGNSQLKLSPNKTNIAINNMYTQLKATDILHHRSVQIDSGKENCKNPEFDYAELLELVMFWLDSCHDYKHETLFFSKGRAAQNGKDMYTFNFFVETFCIQAVSDRINILTRSAPQVIDTNKKVLFQNGIPNTESPIDKFAYMLNIFILASMIEIKNTKIRLKSKSFESSLKKYWFTDKTTEGYTHNKHLNFLFNSKCFMKGINPSYTNYSRYIPNQRRSSVIINANDSRASGRKLMTIMKILKAGKISSTLASIADPGCSMLGNESSVGTVCKLCIGDHCKKNRLTNLEPDFRPFTYTIRNCKNEIVLKHIIYYGSDFKGITQIQLMTESQVFKNFQDIGNTVSSKPDKYPITTSVKKNAFLNNQKNPVNSLKNLKVAYLLRKYNGDKAQCINCVAKNKEGKTSYYFITADMMCYFQYLYSCLLFGGNKTVPYCIYLTSSRQTNVSTPVKTAYVITGNPQNNNISKLLLRTNSNKNFNNFNNKSYNKQRINTFNREINTIVDKYQNSENNNNKNVLIKLGEMLVNKTSVIGGLGIESAPGFRTSNQKMNNKPRNQPNQVMMG